MPFNRFDRESFVYGNAARRRIGWGASIVALVVFAVLPTFLYLRCSQQRAQQLAQEKTVSLELTVPCTFGGVSLMLPQGFYTKIDDGFTYARCKGVSDHVAFIESDPIPREELSKDFLQASFGLQLGKEARNVLKYKEFQIDGRDAVLYRSTFTDEYTAKVTFTVCFIQLPGKTVCITFYEYSDFFTDAFSRSIDSLRVAL